MGTPGEKATGDYIISELSKTGARPKGDNNGWLQTFTIDEGRQIGANALFTVDEHPLIVGREWFPLTLSPPARSPDHQPSPCRKAEFPGSRI